MLSFAIETVNNALEEAFNNPGFKAELRQRLFEDSQESRDASKSNKRYASSNNSSLPQMEIDESKNNKSSRAGKKGLKTSLLKNVRTVVEVAQQYGVDPKLAVAMMLVESGGDHKAVGDNGTSFGLFQLHRGGMLTAAGLTTREAFDPRTNANVSLKNLAKIDDRYCDKGTAAAKSQRPARPQEYARKVNAHLGKAAQLIAMV
ncbi:MAG: lytic transglycosylase domain-containing protein [Candidatus Obscuribacterales bacterium]|nr:lytic transglycosylase domain-containing protein [Candidatus Obscuribacterales bacterium]